ncbi:hypothetical protein T440DRAFT_415346 [Plenodomus tracheiphilus IPT5]|uniref:CmcJ-like methyltransferase n=1 Tax=Plenodomus tracheiphilus IPT5 TaxID=1408161 RepID=A0A6A7BI32_9PLEO|nr:hypothetical protein T440DRAFT_415346 [Plenodomus tracheiphilus IPT5]
MPSTNPTATFRYVKDPSHYRALSDTDAHFVLSAELRTPDQKSRSSNLVFEYGAPTEIQDMRNSEDDFKLDEHGFQVVRHEWGLDDWTDGTSVEGLYFKEVEGLVQGVLGERVRVEIYNWRLRRSGDKGGGCDDGVKYSQPLPTVHIDQTVKGMVKRVHHHMGSEASGLLKGRVRMINIWRPIINPVTNWPLALCDGSTVSPTDLVPTDFITADYVGEMYNVVYRAKHEWYYLSRQRPEEVFLFKIADSKEDVRARYCPHASFPQKGIIHGGIPRESIEVRALVFSE